MDDSRFFCYSTLRVKFSFFSFTELTYYYSLSPTVYLFRSVYCLLSVMCVFIPGDPCSPGPLASMLS
uniref:Uncharacterized protein n=1 Tax=Lepeophtheirus salmonis TaxID=72036 RepID=A0A0K2T4Q5_LEPSM